MGREEGGPDGGEGPGVGGSKSGLNAKSRKHKGYRGNESPLQRGIGTTRGGGGFCLASGYWKEATRSDQPCEEPLGAFFYLTWLPLCSTSLSPFSLCLLSLPIVVPLLVHLFNSMLLSLTCLLALFSSLLLCDCLKVV